MTYLNSFTGELHERDSGARQICSTFRRPRSIRFSRQFAAVIRHSDKPTIQLVHLLATFKLLSNNNSTDARMNFEFIDKIFIHCRCLYLRRLQFSQW